MDVHAPGFEKPGKIHHAARAAIYAQASVYSFAFRNG
jgi:hypothetical protein